MADHPKSHNLGVARILIGGRANRKITDTDVFKILKEGTFNGRKIM